MNVALLERANRNLRRVQKTEDLARIERAMTNKLAAIFRRQGKLFVGELGSIRSKFAEAPTSGDWNPMWDRAAHDTVPGFRVAVDDGTKASYAKGAERIVADLGVATAFTLANPRAVTFLEDHGAELVSNVNETTRGYIRTLMTKAVDEGWSYDQTARTLIARFEQFASGNPLAHIESRAHLIAVTESAFAYEAGNAQVVGNLMEQGLPMEKSWITVGDDRVDEEQCGPNEEQGWIPAEDEFQDGSGEPPAHPGCRCTAGYQMVEDGGPIPAGPA